MAITERTAFVIERSAEAVREARRAVVEACRGLARDVVEIVRLLTSELVTNALTHGNGPIQVEVTRAANRVRVTVDDEESRLPHHSLAHPQAVSGRGLMLVESLSARWGTTPRRTGKSVWFELRTA